MAEPWKGMSTGRPGLKRPPGLGKDIRGKGAQRRVRGHVRGVAGKNPKRGYLLDLARSKSNSKRSYLLKEVRKQRSKT